MGMGAKTDGSHMVIPASEGSLDSFRLRSRVLLFNRSTCK